MSEMLPGVQVNSKDFNSVMGFGYSSRYQYLWVNSSLPGQNGGHFADDIFRCIVMNEKLCILIKMSLKFVPKGPYWE